MTPERLKEIADTLSAMIPDDYGFFLFCGPYQVGERARYISNFKREDALNCMKEFLIKSGHEEDWMKDVI